jgi:hypothetical protein
MKLHTLMQMESVSERIGGLPTFGQTWRDVQVRIAGEQVIEDKVVNTLRLRIQTNPRIEIRRAALDDHHQRVGIRLAAAGKKRKKREKNREG